MFESWGRVVYRRRRLVLVIALLAVAFAAVWGTGVFSRLQSSGGFTPPNSQSQQASNLAALPHSKVLSYQTYWSTSSPHFVSASGRETYAVLELAGSGDAARIKSFD